MRKSSCIYLAERSESLDVRSRRIIGIGEDPFVKPVVLVLRMERLWLAEQSQQAVVIRQGRVLMRWQKVETIKHTQGYVYTSRRVKFFGP